MNVWSGHLSKADTQGLYQALGKTDFCSEKTFEVQFVKTACYKKTTLVYEIVGLAPEVKVTWTQYRGTAQTRWL